MNHMPNSTRFIEDALFCSDPLALSYSDPDQKWIIRQHLLSLLHDFPSLRPSVAVFTHNDGTAVKLLLAAGHLPVPGRSDPAVPVSIWLHELYPHAPPLVFLPAAAPAYPFADSAAGGAAATAYLATWHFPQSSLSGLARSLSRLFWFIHPLCCCQCSSRVGGDRWAHPSTASKIEAMDRLACSAYYDVAEIVAGAGREAEALAAVRAELRGRGVELAAAVGRLEGERRGLKLRSDEMCEKVDRLQNWLRVYGGGGGGEEEAFEGVDEWTEAAVEAAAGDMAVEDLMYKLEEAVGRGVVSFDVYMKQVRVLAREQFFHRAKMDKIRISLQL